MRGSQGCASASVEQPQGDSRPPALAFACLLSPVSAVFVSAQRKNPKKLPVKLEFMKYDPRVNRHVLFTETKLK